MLEKHCGAGFSLQRALARPFRVSVAASRPMAGPMGTPFWQEKSYDRLPPNSQLGGIENPYRSKCCDSGLKPATG